MIIRGTAAYSIGTVGHHGVLLPSHPAPRVTFSNRCLQFPCIVFSVTRIGVQELISSQGNIYRATVPLLGRVELRTADGFMSDSEWDAESNAGSPGDGTDDASAPASSLHGEPSTFRHGWTALHRRCG